MHYNQYGDKMLRKLIIKIKKYLYQIKKEEYELEANEYIQNNLKYRKLHNKTIKISNIDSDIKLYYKENSYKLIIVGEMKITEDSHYFIICDRYKNE